MEVKERKELSCWFEKGGLARNFRSTLKKIYMQQGFITIADIVNATEIGAINSIDVIGLSLEAKFNLHNVILKQFRNPKEYKVIIQYSDY